MSSECCPNCGSKSKWDKWDNPNGEDFDMTDYVVYSLSESAAADDYFNKIENIHSSAMCRHCGEIYYFFNQPPGTILVKYEMTSPMKSLEQMKQFRKMRNMKMKESKA